MLHHGIAPIVGSFPAVLGIAASAASGSGDWATYGAQLGVGGVLVAFAVWLQDRNTKERKAEIALLRLESVETRKEMVATAASQEAKHVAELTAERADHQKTRELLLAALTKGTFIS